MSTATRQRIKVGAKNLDYTLRFSDRARLMYISISGRDEIVVSAPRYSSHERIEQFVRSRARWALRKLDELRDMPEHLFLPHSKRQYAKYKESARSLAHDRLAYFNQQYGFSYQQISIGNQRSRWGSCSRNGNIRFNYKIALLPSHLRDYVIVHELCHLGELNHSGSFWKLVAQTIPDYAARRAELNGRAKRTDPSL